MTKIISLFQTSLSDVDFRSYWERDYLNSILALPSVRNNLVRIDHNHVLPQANIRVDEELETVAWAGISEMWFYDQRSAEAVLSDPQFHEVVNGHAAMPLVVHMHIREIHMWDRGASNLPVKAMALLVPGNGLSLEEAQQYWNVKHVEEGARIGMAQRISKYIQNHRFPGFDSVPGVPDYAGGPEFWFDNLEEAAAIFADEAAAKALKIDEARFSDYRRSAVFVTDQKTVFRDGPAT